MQYRQSAGMHYLYVYNTCNKYVYCTLACCMCTCNVVSFYVEIYVNTVYVFVHCGVDAAVCYMYSK